MKEVDSREVSSYKKFLAAAVDAYSTGKGMEIAPDLVESLISFLLDMQADIEDLENRVYNLENGDDEEDSGIDDDN